MRMIRYLVVGLIAVGLVVTSVGWYLSANTGANGGAERRFDSCHFEGDTLVLRFMYGANQAVAPRVDTRDGGVVVSLTIASGDGEAPAIALLGEARFEIFGGSGPVRYPDGEELPCPKE